MPNEPIIVTETGADGSTREFEITAEVAEGGLVEDIVNALADDGADVTVTEFSDTDGDGKLDTAASDTTGDGKIDMVFQDTDGDGNLDMGVADTDGDGEADIVAFDSDGDGQLDVGFVDTDGDGNADTIVRDEDGDGEFETIEALGDHAVSEPSGESIVDQLFGTPTDEELTTQSVEFNLGSEGFAETASYVEEQSSASVPLDLSASEPIYTDSISADNASVAEDAQQQAQAEAAREAQQAADDFADKGDYAAASEARAQAEEYAGEAGDSSMLGAYGAQDYEYAAGKQEQAEAFQEEQAQKIAEGDYAGAREAAFQAEWATRDADMTAGGQDHTGQAQADQANLDWAVDNQEGADQNARDAATYAAEGDLDKAEIYAARADEYQSSASDYATNADPNSIMYDHDPSSVVDAGGSFDAGYDASAIDTGFDASVDTTPTSFDTTTDDTL